jgi:AMMECR1 domain-containing protein
MSQKVLATDDDLQLLNVVSDKRIELPPFWRNIAAGVFVTMYSALPASSNTIYCCMSNGDYEPLNSLHANIVQSALICTTQDNRRFNGGPPIAKELALFAPQAFWIALGAPKDAARKMNRKKQRAFMVQSNGRRAVYLPEVWDERSEWSASELLQNLTLKATGQATNNNQSTTVYEIPSFVIGDPVLNIGRHDRGFFASLVLERAFSFYVQFMRENQLAYLVTIPDQSAKILVDYDNDGANVRTLADAAAFFKLSILLRDDEKTRELVIDRALAFSQRSLYPADTAARVSLQIDTGREIDSRDINILIHAYPDVRDVSFSNPQIVIALVNANSLVNESQKLQINAIARRFMQVDFETHAEKAIRENGAFAANWLLRALAACSVLLGLRTNQSRSLRFKTSVENCIRTCKRAIANPSSVTEQACAAHGLLASRQYDTKEYDWLIESWARLQSEWMKRRARGGFRYYFDEPWYRTDVTSHIVDVCLILHAGEESDKEMNRHETILSRLGLSY